MVPRNYRTGRQMAEPALLPLHSHSIAPHFDVHSYAPRVEPHYYAPQYYAQSLINPPMSKPQQPADMNTMQVYAPTYGLQGYATPSNPSLHSTRSDATRSDTHMSSMVCAAGPSRIGYPPSQIGYSLSDVHVNPSFDHQHYPYE
jgi:hypothetical protein